MRYHAYHGWRNRRTGQGSNISVVTILPSKQHSPLRVRRVLEHCSSAVLAVITTERYVPP